MSGSKISGTVFLDQNADGTDETGDSGIGGVTVGLYTSAGVLVDSVTTANDGTYAFTGVAAGTYYVLVSAPSGDSFSPAGTSATLPNSVVGATGQTQTITVTSAAAANQTAITNIDAGVYVPVSVSGTVFGDANGDGLVDGTDKGIAGVTVQLLNAQGQPTGATATTNANGAYTFTNLAPGTYSVHVVMPASEPAGEAFSPYGSNTPPEPTNGTVNQEQNLLVNGSFDNGEPTNAVGTTAAGLSGWTVSANTAATPYGSGPGNGPEIDWTNGSQNTAIDPTGATNSFAGTVSPDNANPALAGGSGTHAAFFVDDGAIETLSQTVGLTAGQVYEVGFDLDETIPGTHNVGFFQLSVTIGSVTIVTASSTSGTQLTPGVWTHFADLYTPTVSGPVTLTFAYESGVLGSTETAKDVLVDDVYVVPGQVTPNLTTTSEVNASGTTGQFTLTSGETIGDESAGIYLPPGTISGTVFTDQNADGAQETGDAGISGDTIELISAGTIIATTTTSANGTYSFTTQTAGSYTVRVQQPGGETFSPAGTSGTLVDSNVSASGAATVAVLNGGTSLVNAGLYTVATINGTVFNDVNGDGTQEAGESGLSGQTVDLLGAGGAVIATTTTNANGAYSFTGVVPGSDTIQIVAKTGDVFSTSGSVPVATTSGGSATVNVGEYAPGTISGTVFNDANGDGAQEAGDAGLAGQTVNLLGAGGAVIASTTTNANGAYSFTGVAPGADTVQFVAKAGDTFTTPGSASVTVSSGSAATVNAGEYAPGTISGTVFNDANGDGTQEAGDAGLSGQTVNLLGAGGAVIASTTTNANGAYSFTGIAPGADTVQFVAKAGDTFTTPASDAVTVSSGSAATVNAGEYAPGTISGTVFNDVNGDGTQEAGDAGLAGQTLNLLGAGGVVIATTTTNANGAYSFTGIAPGADTVQFVAKSGDVFSTPASAAVTVSSGSAATVNAGEYAPGTISGTVFNDANGDGTQEAGDAGLSGQTVNLLGAGGAVIASTTTNANGAYSFTGIAPGADTVQFVAKAGDTFTTPASDAVTVGSGSTATFNAGEYGPATISGTVFNDANGDGTQQAGDAGLSGQTVKLLGAGGAVIATTTTNANGAYSFTGIAPGADTVQFVAKAGDTFTTPGSASVTVSSGSAATVNAGEYAPGTISGTVFNDVNGDGAQEAGDAGLSGQTVNLLGAGGAVIATTTTNANGAYSFAGIAPGADTVQFVVKSGDAFSTPASDPVTVSSGSVATVNAGEYAPATISGTVFNDVNGDGAQEAGDAGLAGQTVNLLGAGGAVIATTTTNANGGYAFGGVAPGNDTVQFIAAPGATFSTPGSVPLTITAAGAATVNAGEYVGGTIAGTVFNDLNADGVEDGGDSGLSGQTVELIGSNGQTIATTTTGAGGGYSFGDVAPGADTVQFIAAPGYQFSTAGADPVTVISGSTATVTAGEFAPGAITGTVFNDLNADGVPDGGDSGLSGQTVNLLGAHGQIIATTTTNGSGVYSFTGVNPGGDTIQFIAPAGDTFSTASSDPVTVTSGSAATVNAGLVAPSTITGDVFTDENADGFQESGDAGIAGQTVTLLNAAGATLATTTTDGNGAYSFSGLAPGADTVQFAAAPGDIFSTASSVPVTLTSGSEAIVNAGEYATASLSVEVYADTNGDGAQDNGEIGLADIPVQLMNATGTTTLATAVTDINGNVDFTGLTPGSYEIAVTGPAGDAMTQSMNIGTPITVTSGDPDDAVAGYYTPPPGRIDGFVFVNTACTGLDHVGDANVAGVTVMLLDANGNPIEAAVTNANGEYSFTNVAAGNYEEKFILPNGLSFTTQRVDSPADDAINSAANQTTGETATFSVGGSQDVTDENAGVYLNGNFTGQTPNEVGAGQSVSFNNAAPVIVGSGNDNIHPNSGNSVVLIGSTGSDGGNVVESGPGADIVYSCGPLDAQALGTSDYIFGGSGTNDLQGDSGVDYMMGGPGTNLIVGGPLASTLITGADTGAGTVTTNAQGAITNYTVNNEVRAGGGGSTIVYAAGDGVALLDTFTPGQDTLDIYGYSGGTFETANGHTILYFGGNDAIVFNSVYTPSSGGIVYETSSAPLLVLNFGTDGLPYFTTGNSQLSTTAATTLQTVSASPGQTAAAATAAYQQVLASDAPTFTLTGSSSGDDVLTGGTGADTFVTQGAANTINLAAGDAANTVYLSGSGNVVNGASNDGANVVIFNGGATGSVILGNGANTIMAFGGSGDVINAGSGDNTVFAQISDSTVTLAGGNVFAFGNGNTIDVAANCQVIAAQGSNDVITGGSVDAAVFMQSGSATFTGGNLSFYMFAAGASVSNTGSGSNSAADFSGDATINFAGGGTQLVGLSGTGNNVTIGNGNATVFAGQGDDTVSLGTGTDTVVLGAGDTLSIGGGANQLWVGNGNDTISLTGLGTNDIYFFGNGDTLDLSQLVGAQGGVSALATAANGGSDTLISLTGGSFGAGTVVADLHGVKQSIAGLGANLHL